MKNKFTLGVISGIGVLALAIPILAQVTSAQVSGDTAAQTSSGTAAPKKVFPGRRNTTQEGIQARIAQDDAFLANIDAMVAVQKSATQTHRDALTSAAAITDDTERQAAVQAAEEAYRTALEDVISANLDLKAAMHFGGRGKGFGGWGGPGHGPGKADFASKLGMTEDELKAALEAGKTIEQIATEKGVKLPERPQGGRFPMHSDDGEEASAQ